MVVTLLPTTCETGVEHDRVAAPSTCTVHAPQRPAPQPNFVPVSSSVSRSTHSKGVSSETLTFFSLPLMRSVISAIAFRELHCHPDNHPTQPARKVEWAGAACPKLMFLGFRVDREYRSSRTGKRIR